MCCYVVWVAMIVRVIRIVSVRADTTYTRAQSSPFLFILSPSLSFSFSLFSFSVFLTLSLSLFLFLSLFTHSHTLAQCLRAIRDDADVNNVSALLIPQVAS